MQNTHVHTHTKLTIIMKTLGKSGRFFKIHFKKQEKRGRGNTSRENIFIQFQQRG